MGFASQRSEDFFGEDSEENVEPFVFLLGHFQALELISPSYKCVEVLIETKSKIPFYNCFMNLLSLCQ